jgi:hypothetical protein
VRGGCFKPVAILFENIHFCKSIASLTSNICFILGGRSATQAFLTGDDETSTYELDVLLPEVIDRFPQNTAVFLPIFGKNNNYTNIPALFRSVDELASLQYNFNHKA